MRVEWDEAKRQTNLQRHGFDFLDAEKILDDETVSFLDDRFDYGEIRVLTFGVLRGRVVAITHTETDEAIRIISIRKASRSEEETYFKKIRD
jgi:uncharacterized protein